MTRAWLKVAGTCGLLGDVGGYVLAGVTSFAAAVIAVLCIRYRDWLKTRSGLAMEKRGTKKAE